MTLQSILLKGREEFKRLYLAMYGYPMKNMQGREVALLKEKFEELDEFLAHHQSEILEAVVEIAKLLKEQELPRACEDYSNDLDERIHFDDGYTEAINNIISELKKVK